jgi:tetratricopeptide (TPR) repeat protein
MDAKWKSVPGFRTRSGDDAMGIHEDTLAQALQYHRAGHLDQAEHLYRQILEADPAQAEVWFNLGDACLTRGRFDDAVTNYQRAVDLGPPNAAAHNNLGVSFAQLGKSDQAVACLRQAIQCQPDYAEAHNNLGIVLSQQGKLTEAFHCYQQALRINPNYAEAHSNLGLVLGSLGKLAEAISCHQRALAINPAFAGAQNNLHQAWTARERLTQEMANYQLSRGYMLDSAAAYNDLGLVLKSQGRLTEAIASFQEALQHRPDFAEAHNNLGVTFKERGNTAEATASLRQALALKPGLVEASNNLGTILESMGNLDEASAYYHQALRGRPDFAEVHNNLGVVLNKQGKHQEALDHYHRALQLKPDYGDAHHNLGTVLVDLGRLSEGVASYERALKLKPDYVEAHLGRAQAWLQMGDFERGWPEFEWRWRRKEFPPRPFAQPLWDGSPLAGRTILLHAEQGFGDTLQFIRFTPLVKQRGGHVIVECQDVLLPLLATGPGIDRIVARESALPPFDTHAPLVSLPRILRTTLAAVPAEVPYLAADPGSLERWRPAVGSDQAFKIGIAWQGNPGHSNDRNRSVPLVHFEPLAQVDGVRLLSLQKGPGSEQLAGAAERFAVTDLASQFQTFQDTAGVLKNLDLVVTVDSAVAHCAGALGVPVWVLLPFAADWRWLLHREDNPWYPTMRLFRQKEPCQWAEVFARIAAEVRHQVEAKSSQEPALASGEGR